MRQEFSFYYAAIPDSNKKAEKGSKIQLISCSLSGELPLWNLDAAFFFCICFRGLCAFLFASFFIRIAFMYLVVLCICIAFAECCACVVKLMKLFFFLHRFFFRGLLSFLHRF